MKTVGSEWHFSTMDGKMRPLFSGSIGMALKATEVFTPGSFPEHTYVNRNDEKLEEDLRNALDTPGQVISLSGPSKSGKTVLVERVVGKDNLIPLTGAGIEDPEEIWTKVLNWMNVPTTTSESMSNAVTGGAELGGALKVPAALEISGKGTLSGTGAQSQGNEFARSGLEHVVREIANSDYVVLIDDFHYMARQAQEATSKVIKEAVRRGVKICAASVTHRGDDVVRALPELRGRVRSIDLKYWNIDDLMQIGIKGFDALRGDASKEMIRTMALEAAGSPHLMQLICLSACFTHKLKEKVGLLSPKVVLNDDGLREALEYSSSSTDFRSLVDVLDAGPRIRGTERKTYKFRDGTSGDVYKCILKAVAADPPSLSFDYNQLNERVERICAGEVPVGSSIQSTCRHMGKLALDKFPQERAIDWDEQKQILDLPDPYLLFYLRWSGRLAEQEQD